MASLNGDVSVMSVADVLIWLGNRERTGTLVLAQDPIVKHISIERGHAVRISSVSPREELGQFFIDFGMLTAEQVRHAENVRKEADMRLGRVLALGNLLPEEEVKKIVEHQIRESVLDTVRWDVGQFEFHAGELPLAKPEVPAAISLLSLHRLAAERAPAWEAFHTHFPRLDLTFMIHEEQLASMPDGDVVRDRIVHLIAGGATLEGVLQQELLMEYDLYARIHEMVQAGVLKTIFPRTSSPMDFAFEMAQEAAVDDPATHVSIPAPRMPSSIPPPPMTSSRPRPVLPSVPPSPIGPAPGRGSLPVGLRFGTSPPPPPAKRMSGGPPGGWGRTPPAPPTDEPARMSNLAVQGAVPHLKWPLEEALRVRTSPRERYILKRIDGMRTVADILQIVPMPDGEAIELLRGLAAAGLIKL